MSCSVNQNVSVCPFPVFFEYTTLKIPGLAL